MKKSIFGIILFIIGLAILIINAADYLGGFFGLSMEIHLPSSGIGIVFLVVGMYQLRLFKSHKPAAAKERKES